MKITVVKIIDIIIIRRVEKGDSVSDKSKKEIARQQHPLRDKSRSVAGVTLGKKGGYLWNTKKEI